MLCVLNVLKSVYAPTAHAQVGAEPGSDLRVPGAVEVGVVRPRRQVGEVRWPRLRAAEEVHAEAGRDQQRCAGAKERHGERGGRLHVVDAQRLRAHVEQLRVAEADFLQEPHRLAEGEAVLRIHLRHLDPLGIQSLRRRRVGRGSYGEYGAGWAYGVNGGGEAPGAVGEPYGSKLGGVANGAVPGVVKLGGGVAENVGGGETGDIGGLVAAPMPSSTIELNCTRWACDVVAATARRRPWPAKHQAVRVNAFKLGTEYERCENPPWRNFLGRLEYQSPATRSRSTKTQPAMRCERIHAGRLVSAHGGHSRAAGMPRRQHLIAQIIVSACHTSRSPSPWQPAFRHRHILCRGRLGGRDSESRVAGCGRPRRSCRRRAAGR